MGWRIVYIEESDKVRLYLDNLKIESEKYTDVTIPLSDIHTLIIDNPKTLLSVQLINKCSQYNINFILCSIEHMPYTIIQPFAGNKSLPYVLRKQLKWSDDAKKVVHKAIIQNKIKNQRKLLETKNKDIFAIDKLKEYEASVELADTTNREGLAAKVYFRALFGPLFRRFEEDVTNAGLNFGYQILRSQISKTLLSKGLHPSFGIIHYGADNVFNLSDDIIEVFRPLVDCYVEKYISDASVFKKEHRMGLIELTTSCVKVDDITQTLFNAINQYIDGIIAFFETGAFDKLKTINIEYDKI